MADQGGGGGMPGMGKLGYDRAIVTFSPDGRLFQVEYAREAVKRGTTVIGITYDGGVVLATVKDPDPLTEPTMLNDKIQKIDDHIGVVSAGLLGDARVMVDKARMRAQVNRITYEEPISTESLVRSLADFKQAHTQYAGLRPMGVSFLIGGVNDEAGLFETDQGGSIFQWKAHAIGRGAKAAREILRDEWSSGMSEEDALELAVETLKNSEEESSKDNVEMAVIDDDGFRALSGDEMDEALSTW